MLNPKDGMIVVPEYLPKS